MNALTEVAAAGGRVWAEGDKLKYRLSKGRPDLLETLRENKPAIMAELKQRTGNDDELMRRCDKACQDLPVNAADLLASLNDRDKAVQLSGEASPEALRTKAECMAERAGTGLAQEIERAYAWLRKELAKNPEYRRAVCTVGSPDTDPVLIAVAVRRVGFATLRIVQSRYRGREFELLEIIDRGRITEPAINDAVA